MVLFFTRFTDEIFSLLISVIFIMEATKDITGASDVTFRANKKECDVCLFFSALFLVYERWGAWGGGRWRQRPSHHTRAWNWLQDVSGEENTAVYENM